MTRAGSFQAIVLLPFVVAGCVQDGPVSPRTSPDGFVPAFAQSPPPDVSGTWNWSRTVQLTAPDWVAAGIFGIPPEGPITHFRCFAWGTFEIVQTGRTFTGTAHRDGSDCETRGGFHFAQGEADAVLLDGLIHGNGVEFTLIEDNGTLIGSYRGAVWQAMGGVATAMRGTGRYTIPGHPSSPVPLDPPPAGTSKVLGWDTWR